MNIKITNMEEKNLITGFIDIMTMYGDDIDVNVFIENLTKGKNHILNTYPESSNWPIRVELDCNEEYGEHTFRLRFTRFETDKEYKARVSADIKRKDIATLELYKKIRENKEEVINYLKSIGEI